MKRGRRRGALAVAFGLVGSLLSGCGGQSPSALSPSGPKSHLVSTSWWILFGVAVTVCVIIFALVILAAVLRRGDKQVKFGDAKGIVMVFGVVIPALILASTFALSVGDIAKSSNPPGPTPLTIEVVGHQWWWEVRYPGGDAVTANEIHVPVGTPVRLRLRTADVIHSFWVPQVMPKMDLLPKRVNETWLSVSRPGTYRGQCAEYCGLQHANMAFDVVAQPRSDFRTWLARESRDAPSPTTPSARNGMRVFTTTTCATCHTIRGTAASGRVGPDLTHVGSRQRLAAGAIPNDFGHMAGWVANSQTVKPGNKMPPQRLSPSDLRDVVTYLRGLR